MDETRSEFEPNQDFNFDEPAHLRQLEMIRARKIPIPGISPAGAMGRRYLAACLDSTIAFIFSAIVVSGLTIKLLPEQWVVLPGIMAVAAYLGYFLSLKL